MELVARRDLERATQYAIAMSTWSFLLRVVGNRPAVEAQLGEKSAA